MNTIKRCFRNKKFVFSLIILLPMIFIALFGSSIAPHDPLEMHTTNTLAAASAQFPMGTDEYGRCIFSRLLYGIRPSLTVSLLGTLGAFLIGSFCGLVAGYIGGKAGNAIMRTVETILCFPAILLAMMVVCLFGAGVQNLTIVVAILYIPHFARIANSSTIKVKKMEYVENDISVGQTTPKILIGTIFRNIFSPLIIQISLTISSAILLESGLSFLGLGVQPPEPSWGQMIGDAKAYLSVNMMYMLWPALFLCLTILAVNLMGDALRDIFDPKLQDSF
ncbi:MAG: ABC transporter permease [Clostridiales bacterium]|jgi:peptide/nickel transport system permease protein|nr:ABC transporter permease [Clostridiales bacterium]MCI1962440.1 ABC transporter permease [Clostridiales bacterium]MCI2022708.1 ABC transporter permease [Clostridiales bacterium]MCI2026977.1 ABC transporter permease [Clostridiales bacterium]